MCSSRGNHLSPTGYPRATLLRFCCVQTQKAGGVVEDVTLLVGEEVVVGILNEADGVGHQLGPFKLVGAEHDAVFEACVDEALCGSHRWSKNGPRMANPVYLARILKGDSSRMLASSF